MGMKVNGINSKVERTLTIISFLGTIICIKIPLIMTLNAMDPPTSCSSSPYTSINKNPPSNRPHFIEPQVTRVIEEHPNYSVAEKRA
jgi:hypothetical protein